jgi:hypothetical protein
MFGYPDADSIECLIQGFFEMFFFPPTWIYTTFLCYQLRCIFIDKKVWLSFKSINLITWTITCLLAFVPLLFGSEYGEDDEYSGISPCNIRSSSQQTNDLLIDVWLGVSFLSMIIMSYFSIQIFIFVKKEGIDKSHRMYNLYKSIRYYPLGLIITWSPSLVIYIMGFFDPSIQLILPKWLFNNIQNISTQYGTILCIIFFSNSERARKNWKKLFFKSKDDDDIFFIEDKEESIERYLNELDYDVDENVISPPLENENRVSNISTRKSLEVSCI